MNKVKGGDAAAEGAAEGEVPVEATAAAQENGEEVAVEGGEQAAGAGGVSGLAQGLMMKAMSGRVRAARQFRPPASRCAVLASASPGPATPAPNLVVSSLLYL